MFARILRSGALAVSFTAASALILAIGEPAQGVTFDWVTVGDPGNPADTRVMSDGTTGYGAVAEVYRISKFEVTAAQYVEFLNAVASTDTRELYNPLMAAFLGTITQSGTPGSFSYAAIAGRENMPANRVSFYDVLRFVNWLENGQPTGAQDSSTTEDGTYTITAVGILNNSITRRGLRSSSPARTSGTRRHTTTPPLRATSSIRRGRTYRRPAPRPGRRLIRQTVSSPQQMSPAWAATQARQARAGPSTRAVTSGN